MADFGAFSVEPAQISRLGGANFGQFVNKLLDAETAKAGIVGAALTTTYKENVGDEGVDAGLANATATRWIPEGDSAWQFKAGDLSPEGCKTEVAKPRVLEILRKGGTYRLALGASLTDAKVAKRKKAIEEKLGDLKIKVEPGTVEVLTGDSLARWTEDFPALAVSPLLGAGGVAAQTFDQWSRSVSHPTTWVSSEARDRQIDELRSLISEGTQIDVHIEGVSGLGKTRLVLEALRDQPYEPLVVYAPYADQFPMVLLNQLQTQGRTEVIVVDECDAKQHEIYRSMLQDGTTLRLITIGEPSGKSTRTPMLGLEPLVDEAMTELLRKNEPNLRYEAIRVIVEVAVGNVDYALKAAKAVIESGANSADALITADDIRSFITDRLPDGALFLACCALAMFSRFGYEREVAPELTAIAEGFGIAETELRQAVRALEDAGLLAKQGRYRSVGPHPVAIYLASRGWKELGPRILTGLLPNVDEDMTERLFRRAAEIGDTASTRSALDGMLGASGIAASLDVLSTGNNAKLITHLAVMAPRLVTQRLADLLDSLSDEEIQSITSGPRRNLVWTLEKLAWHSFTFEVAADLLLRLALEETEKYSNNATGTWVELFGAMLPGTAASPETRVSYLKSHADSEDERVRQIIVNAATQALSIHESIMVSGELQGGVIVEPRGVPATWGDVWQYRNSALDLLEGKVNDPSPDVAAAALKALVAAIHPILEVEPVLEHLTAILTRLNSDQLRAVQSEILSLSSLFDRVDNATGRAAALEKLKAALPAESTNDRLWALARSHAWDLREGALTEELEEAARASTDSTAVDALFALLSEKLFSAFQIGLAIAAVADDFDAVEARAAEQLDGPNPDAFVGYLRGRVNAGELAAFDTFIDTHDLDPGVKLRLTVSGPRTDRAAERIDALLSDVSVGEAARALFSWGRELGDERVVEYLTSWADRLDAQIDYNAVVDFMALYLHGKQETPAVFRPVVSRLVGLRGRFPSMGQQEWDWTQLAARQLAESPKELALVLVDLVESGALSAYEGSQEAGLFQQSIQAAGNDVWVRVMDAIDAGSWRLSFAARGWLASAVPLNDVDSWVGGSVERARTVSSVASIGDATVSEIGQYLLDNFGDDDRVSSSLVGEFVSGVWSGNQSDRIARQIGQVNAWIDAPAQSRAVKKWARNLLAYLEAQRAQALEREQEGDW